MKENLDKKLCEKYPEIFSQRHGNMRETAMCWGFECGDGWYWLIDRLCGNIVHHQKQEAEENIRDARFNSMLAKAQAGDFTEFEEVYGGFSAEFREEKRARIADDIPQEVVQIFPVIALQVKEKFGGLRFYYKGGDDYVANIVSFAEDLSYHTCELCGSTQEIGYTDGWIFTWCKSCFEKQKAAGRDVTWHLMREKKI